MSAESPSTGAGDRDAALKSARAALRGVCLALPHLSGLAHEVRIQADPRCETAGVFSSGRLVLNPEWWLALKPPEAVFVMAHELLHLAFDSHGRCDDDDHWLVNVAHDYIINDILEEELEVKVPAGGLSYAGARHQSLEWWVGFLKSDRERGRSLPSHPFASPRRGGTGIGNLGEAFDRCAGALPASVSSPQGDVLPDELEREWFPGDTASGRVDRKKIVRAASTRASSLGVLRHDLGKVWKDYNSLLRVSGSDLETMAAIQTAYQPPWELAMQRWFDSTGPATRSYQRASRRGSERADGIVLPGRKREGWTLHLVLDTSGSMHHVLPGLLGVIASFAEANHMDQIHLIQADGHPAQDQWVEVSSLTEVELRGLADGDLVAPLGHLAKDPQVEAVVVVTDGAEPYPEEAPPFKILWAVPGPDRSFDPGYGQVIVLPNDAWRES